MNVQEEITRAAVAEEVSSNVWESLACHALDYTNYEELQTSLDPGEEAYLETLPDKKGYKKNGKLRISALPAAWKGAKSVLKKAYERDVPWLDENGNIRGKSAVQRDAAAAVSVPTDSSLSDTLTLGYKFLNSLEKLPSRYNVKDHCDVVGQTLYELGRTNEEAK